MMLMMVVPMQATAVTWEVPFELAGGSNTALTVDPYVGGTVYAGSTSGIYKSINSGASWSSINTGLTSTNVSSVIVVNGTGTPTTPNIMYAGMKGAGVFKSVDAGVTWTDVSQGNVILFPGSIGALGNKKVTDLAVSASVANRIYAATRGGVYISANAGSTWGVSNTGLTDLYANAIAVDPFLASTVYLATEGGMFKSVNSGANWTAINAGLAFYVNGNAKVYFNVQALAVDKLNSNTLYVGQIAHGLYKSVDGGVNWSALGAASIGKENIKSIVVDPYTATKLYVGSDKGMFKSIDGGANWTAVNTGLNNLRVSHVVMDTYTLNGLYLGTNGSGVFKSSNARLIWGKNNIGMTYDWVRDIAIDGSSTDPYVSTSIYAGTAGGFFKSMDSGGVWSASNTGLSNQDVRTVEEIGGIVYVGTWGGGVFKSTNAGTNWSPINTGLNHLNMTSIDAENTTSLYASTWGGGVYKLTTPVVSPTFQWKQSNNTGLPSMRAGQSHENSNLYPNHILSRL